MTEEAWEFNDICGYFDDRGWQIELPIGTEFKIGNDTYLCAEFHPAFPNEGICDYCDFRPPQANLDKKTNELVIPFPCAYLKCSWGRTDRTQVRYLKLAKPKKPEKFDSFKKTISIKTDIVEEKRVHPHDGMTLDELIGRDDVECYESVDFDC